MRGMVVQCRSHKPTSVSSILAPATNINPLMGIFYYLWCMNEFNWVKDIEAGEYYIIQSEQLFNKLSSDEWILLEVTSIGPKVVVYRILHYNLHPKTFFSKPNKLDNQTETEWFYESLKDKYWTRVYSLPKYTLFDHQNNKLL